MNYNALSRPKMLRSAFLVTAFIFLTSFLGSLAFKGKRYGVGGVGGMGCRRYGVWEVWGVVCGRHGVWEVGWLRYGVGDIRGVRGMGCGRYHTSLRYGRYGV